MKIGIVVAYFGKLPGYYQLFLDSCKNNSNYYWIIFSDDITEYDYPENVYFVKMSFEECKKKVQSKFDFPISLQTPQKLCDYKCAYGMIFEEYLNNFDWWGHCDLDQIFGDLDKFITLDMLNKYDKLFSLGHLTLYRNTFDNNRIFMNKLNGVERYREVFSTERGCGFDEWLPSNVNEIYIQYNQKAYLENIGGDINPYKTVFELVNFDINDYCYKTEGITNSIFKIVDGCVYQIYEENGVLRRREFPYIHLQKRSMKDKRNNKVSGEYYIVPNCFVDGDNIPEKLLRNCLMWKLWNFQFFKVKIKSLKYRIKNADWEFSNVFKL